MLVGGGKEGDAYRIVAIDPGTNCCGFSVLRLDLPTLQIYVDSVYTLYKKDILNTRKNFALIHSEKDAKLLGYKEHLTKVLNRWEPDSLCIEACYLSRFPAAFGALKEQLMVFRLAAWDFNRFMPVNLTEPSTVKANLKVKVSKNKDDMTVGLRRRKDIVYDPSVSFDKLDEHSIDSIAIGLVHMDRLLARLKKK